MQHPVVIIGAGPIGLAAAANASERNLDFVVLEAGRDAGAAVGEWAHVRLFSSWCELVDPAARRLLDASGTWTAPEDSAYPTGQEWREAYLQPLADLLDASPGGSVRYDTRVIGVGRAGRDLMVDSGREGDPFAVHLEGPAGRERLLGGRGRGRVRHLDPPEPAGRRRLSGPGRERERRPRHLRHPRLLRPGRRRPLRRQAHRRGRQGSLGPGGSRRPGRTGAQGRRHPRLVAAAPAERGRRVRRRGQRPARAARQARPGRQGSCHQRAGDQRDPVPHRVRQHPAPTGGSPSSRSTASRSTTWTRSSSSPGSGPTSGSCPRCASTSTRPSASARVLADQIHPDHHSCGDVPRHGYQELAQPEPGLFLVGMKSYGRAPSFLAMTGYEQVRSVVAALDGDLEAAGARRAGAARDRGVQRGRRL